MGTYVVSLYFDDETDNWLRELIQKIANKTGKHYMDTNNIPPHITVAMIKSEDCNNLTNKLDKIVADMTSGEIEIVSVGIFKTSVVFLQPVLNRYLYDVSTRINALVPFEQASANRYMPFQWMPHITIAKRLTDKEQIETIRLLQAEHIQRKGIACNVRLAVTKPYSVIRLWKLGEHA